MTTLAGPPRARGMLEMMRASVKAVATSPSASTCARQCVGCSCEYEGAVENDARQREGGGHIALGLNLEEIVCWVG